jgi:type I restriction enzyme S subunit
LSHISPENFRKLSNGKFKKGDILFCLRGTLGKFARVENDISGAIASSLIIIRPKSSIHPDYLKSYLGSNICKEQIELYRNGAAQPNLAASSLKKFEVPLPAISEQRRIAAILDKADVLRRKRKRALELLDELAESIFLEMFGDDRSSDFRVSKLDAVCDQITDGAHFTPTYVEDGIPFLRVTDIQDDHIDWGAVKYIPLNEHKVLVSRCCPQRGDVLLSKNGTIGIPRFIDWDREFSIFVSLCLIKPSKGLLSGRYLTAFLKTKPAQRQLRQHSKTGTVTNLHLREIRDVHIPIPPLGVQRRWEEFEASHSLRKGLANAALTKSEGLFASLQSRAFSGQL